MHISASTKMSVHSLCSPRLSMLSKSYHRALGVLQTSLYSSRSPRCWIWNVGAALTLGHALLARSTEVLLTFGLQIQLNSGLISRLSQAATVSESTEIMLHRQRFAHYLLNTSLRDNPSASISSLVLIALLVTLSSIPYEILCSPVCTAVGRSLHLVVSATPAKRVCSLRVVANLSAAQ